MNIQPISKTRYVSNGLLSFHSIFDTIQGEGPFAGSPAIFIRLAGCNLRCPKCDTDYTTGALEVLPEYVLNKVGEFNRPDNRLIVITGGEPFRQNITPLVETLLEKGHPVQVETNGTLFLAGFPYDRVTIVCSPKAGKINKQLAQHIGAFKYVVEDGRVNRVDGLPTKVLGHSASPHVARPPAGFTGPIFVQPTDEGSNEAKNLINEDVAIRSCMKHGYILCLQIHKIIGME